MSSSGAPETLEVADWRLEEPPGREAEDDARRWPALMAVLWRVMSFSEGVVSRPGRTSIACGDDTGGGEVAIAAWEGGERW